jgi:hypothetical protein
MNSKRLLLAVFGLMLVSTLFLAPVSLAAKPSTPNPTPDSPPFALYEAVMDIQNKVTAIYNVFFDFMDYIAERFDDILDYIGLRFDEVQEDIQDGFGDIQGDIETGFDEIQGDIQTGFSDIQDEFDALQSQISASIGDNRTIHTTTQTYQFDYTDTLPAEWFITVEGDTNAPFELLSLYIDIEGSISFRFTLNGIHYLPSNPPDPYYLHRDAYVIGSSENPGFDGDTYTKVGMEALTAMGVTLNPTAPDGAIILQLYNSYGVTSDYQPNITITVVSLSSEPVYATIAQRHYGEEP